MDLHKMMWNEMATIKKEDCYYRRHIKTQQYIKIALRFFTLFAATIGVLAAKGYIPVSNIAIFFLIIGVQLLQSILPNIIASDETIDHHKNIKSRISRLFMEYEELFYLLHHKKISEEECLKKRKKLIDTKLIIDSDSYKKTLFLNIWHLRQAEKEANNILKLY
jgi:hypothetical protein